MPAPYSNDFRIRVVTAYEEGKGSYRKLADFFSISLWTILDWVSRYRKTGAVDPNPKSQTCRSHLTEQELDVIEELHNNNPDKTLAELSDAVWDKTGKYVCCATLHRFFQKRNITHKKKSFSADQQDREDIQQEREAFKQRQPTLNPDDLIFIDETGIHLAMSRMYGRCQKGERLADKRPAHKGQITSMIGALTSKGIIAAMTIPGTVDGAVFLAFTKEVLVPQLKPGKIVLLDNLSTHKVKGVREAIESAGASLEYLPSYSPDLNPIEECWSKVKAFLKSMAARTTELLDMAVTDALETVTVNDCTGWFTHAGYCTGPI